MSEIQESVESQLTRLIDLLNDDLVPTSDNCSAPLLFTLLAQKLWVELPLSCEQGSALATASCLPVWEALNFFTAPSCTLSLVQKCFVLNLLSALYPKSKDRRSTYQQLSCGGSESTPLPLSVTFPIGSETLLQKQSEEVLRDVFLSSNTIFLEHFTCYERGKHMAAKLRSFVYDILPRCTILASEKYRNVAIFSQLQVRITEKIVIPWISFCSGIWKFIILSEVLNISEGRELSSFLINSPWASKKVVIDGKNTMYKSLFNSLVDSSLICLSLNGRIPSTSTDNTPLIDPRIIANFLQHKKIPTLIHGRRHQILAKKKSAKYSVSNFSVKEKCRKLEKTLFIDIPSDVKNFGSSSSCRDCDQLTMLCRGCIFYPFPLLKCPARGKKTPLHTMLFNRKGVTHSQGRGEGPSLLPTRSSLADLLEETRPTCNTLERLASLWSEG